MNSLRSLSRRVQHIKPLASNLNQVRYGSSLAGKKVLISNALGNELPSVATDLLKSEGASIEVMEKELDRETRYEKLLLEVKTNPYHAIYCCLEDRIDGDMIENSFIKNECKVISTLSVGVNHIAKDKCNKYGISIGYTPEVLTETTADLVVGLTLTTARMLVAANAGVHNGQWQKNGIWHPTWMAGKDVHSSTIGIVGSGRIGAAVARRFKGFGNSKILYCNYSNKPNAAFEEIGAKFVSFDQILEESDFVVPMCPLTPQTKGLFGKNEFSRMKKDAMFINCARGDIVKQDELITALKNGDIAAAGLDVTTPEPLPLDNELLTLPNVTILPHIGSASMATRAIMSRLAAQNIIDVFNKTESKYLLC